MYYYFNQNRNIQSVIQQWCAAKLSCKLDAVVSSDISKKQKLMLSEKEYKDFKNLSIKIKTLRLQKDSKNPLQKTE